MVEITVLVPDDLTSEEARLLLASKLFELHRIPIGRAAEIAGYPRNTFMEVASKHGTAIFDHPPGELEDEMNS